jgi:hypothetical protein
VGGFGEDDFVLHTSQSYIRASQPAISPNVAAGLSVAEPEQQEEEELQQDDDEEEQLGAQPFTTPSQNSKVGALCLQEQQRQQRPVIDINGMLVHFCFTVRRWHPQQQRLQYLLQRVFNMPCCHCCAVLAGATTAEPIQHHLQQRHTLRGPSRP